MPESSLHDAIDPLWRELRGYAQRLVADLSEADMVAQPVADRTLNHPAWVLSHLNLYAPLLADILRGEPVEDPIDAPFGRGSVPSPDRGTYPGRDELLEGFLIGHDGAMDALRAAPASRLAEPPPIDRWAARFESIAPLTTHILVRHPAHHLGQLSAWRRAIGLRSV